MPCKGEEGIGSWVGAIRVCLDSVEECCVALADDAAYSEAIGSEVLYSHCQALG